MNMTIAYLDRLQATYDGASDYKMSKMLGIGTSTICNYRKERSFMDINIAYRLAILIKENPAKVIAETQLDHKQKPESELLFQWMLDVSKRPETPAPPSFQAA